LAQLRIYFATLGGIVAQQYNGIWPFSEQTYIFRLSWSGPWQSGIAFADVRTDPKHNAS
jgi:hypothetical protein